MSAYFVSLENLESFTATGFIVQYYTWALFSYWNSRAPAAGQQKQHFYPLGLGEASEIAGCFWQFKKLPPNRTENLSMFPFWTVFARQASIPSQIISPFPKPFCKSCLSVKSCSLVPLGTMEQIVDTVLCSEPAVQASNLQWVLLYITLC